MKDAVGRDYRKQGEFKAMKKLNLNNRRFKYGTIATVITILFIAAVVLINVIVGIISDRHSADIDLTSQKVFEITDQTKDFLKTLDKEVTITVLSDESTMQNAGIAGKHVAQVLDKYKQNSDKITVQYIDPDKNPQVITQFNKSYKGDLTSSLVIVQCGDKIKPITESQLISYTQTGTYSSSMSSTTEQAMTSAILFVTDDKPVVATILTTDSVQNAPDITSMLSTNGYVVEQTNALTGEINPATQLLILMAPQSDLPASSVDNISKFLDNDGKLGRSLIYVASNMQKDTPNIDALLAEYGLQVDSGIVYDMETRNMVSTSDGNYGMFVFPSQSDPYSQYLTNFKNPVFVPRPSPITLLYDTKDSRETFSLLSTAATSIIVPEDAGQDFDPSKQQQAAQTVLAVGSRYVYDNDKKVTSNIMACGSLDLMNSAWLQESSIINQEYMLSAINVMVGRDAGITIAPKSLTSTTLQVTQSNAVVIFIVTVVVIPLALIALGIVIWARRKHR